MITINPQDYGRATGTTEQGVTCKNTACNKPFRAAVNGLQICPHCGTDQLKVQPVMNNN